MIWCVAALDAADAHLFYDVNVEIQLTLGQADRSCADSAADLEREMTRAAAHDLNDRAALVRLHGVAQLVDALDRSVGTQYRSRWCSRCRRYRCRSCPARRRTERPCAKAPVRRGTYRRRRMQISAVDAQVACRCRPPSGGPPRSSFPCSGRCTAWCRPCG